MIKLDELKKGDKIFRICDYHWCQEIEITEERREFEYQSLDQPTIYVVVGKSLEKDWGMQREQLFYYDEEKLFRTEDEARNQMKLHRDKQKEEWSNKDDLIKYMFEKFKRSFPDAEKELIEEIMEGK
jgi:pheromone shutdown protein TraB